MTGVPKHVVIVALSGVASIGDVEADLKTLGVGAILVGETIIRAKTRESVLKSFAYVGAKAMLTRNETVRTKTTQWEQGKTQNNHW